MMIEVETPNWFGLGLGARMTDAQDMWIFTVSKTGIEALDGFSNHYQPSYDD